MEMANGECQGYRKSKDCCGNEESTSGSKGYLWKPEDGRRTQ
jgi:hypothetical protein